MTARSRFWNLLGIPPPVGRSRELETVDRFLAAAQDGFAALAIEGEAGIGKTAVWSEALRRARAAGFRVLSCRPGQAETRFALSALADLLEPVEEDTLAALPAVQRRALETALLRAGAAGTSGEPRVLAAAVRSLLRALAAREPVVVAVDDAHWVDAPSAATLQFALRRLGDARLGLLTTRRADEPGGLTAGRRAPDAEGARLTLGPLTLDETRVVLQGRPGLALSRSTLIRLHQAARGNPLFALEIAQVLAEEGLPAAGEPLPVPSDVRSLVGRRVARLPPATRELLLLAALLGRPRVDAIGPAPAGLDDLAPALADGIVELRSDELVFAHPLFAAALVTGATSEQCRDAHRRLATVVDDPEERARHLAAASADPDPLVAQELAQAAGVARARGAWAGAAELLEQARRLTPADRPDEDRAYAIQAAENLIHAGERTRARALLEAVVATGPPRPLLAEALRLLAEISTHDANYEASEELYAQALEAADDPQLATCIELARCYVSSQQARWPEARDQAIRGIALAEAAGDLPRVAQGLALSAISDFLCGNGVDWAVVERSTALEDESLVVQLQMRPRTIAACLLLYVDRLDEARERFRAQIETTRDRGDESDLAFALLWSSWLETRAGDLEAAADVADEAAALAQTNGSPSDHGWAMAQRAYVHAHRGEVAETRQACAATAESIARYGMVLPQLWLAASLSLLELARGDAAAAWAACEPLVAGLERDGITEPVPSFYLPNALEALVALGELDRAEALVDALEARGRALDRAWALAIAGRCRGLVLAARGDLDGAAAALDGALTEHERLGMPFEHARTLLVSGAVQRRRRRRTRAKACFEEAHATFAAMGAIPWRDRAAGELERVGLRRSAGSELTESERRIAELAASGLTNRDMAARLFVSPKTVEATLARAYRKLGVRTRAELGARMAATPYRDGESPDATREAAS